MTFLEFMQVMFDLQKQFPEMTWEVEQGPFSYSAGTVRVNLPVSAENAELLRQAREMFAPVEG